MVYTVWFKWCVRDVCVWWCVTWVVCVVYSVCDLGGACGVRSVCSDCVVYGVSVWCVSFKVCGQGVVRCVLCVVVC